MVVGFSRFERVAMISIVNKEFFRQRGDGRKMESRYSKT